MLCDECKKKEATVHMTSVINNKKTESHLCADCAAKHGGSGSPFGTFGFGGSIFDNDFFTNDFFTNAVYPDGMLGRRGQTCSGCGMTFADFNRTGKFGCDRCYETFAGEIDPLVKRLQGSLDYEGRVPGRGTGVFKTKHQIKRLRQELTKAIQAEHFEEAAKLRDEIKVLEDSLQQGEA
ncbi:UvrB/UvrC motif-containing protein [Veillonella magna]|jgi:protein arginine kinase activator|uniref:UvrB/UvrC motif-containing protein n=1 Tax=Veillonella magna TaxID=464322 RepID=UPI0023F1302B|nr:UvrB/UvrC motif-containing protein [Veillonella magna]